MPEPQYRYLITSTHAYPGVLLVTLTESHVRSDELADALRDELLDAVTRSGVKQVVLNFGQVVFISSAGLRPLIRLRRKLQDEGGQLRICNLSESVADVFNTTRIFTAPFEIQPDVPSAVANLEAGAQVDAGKAPSP